MADPVNKPPEIVTPADVEREIDELLKLADREAKRIQELQRRKVVRTRKTSPVRAESPRKPDAHDLLREDLRSALTDEVVIAPQAQGDGDIEPGEFEREIMKRALIKLKLSDLRDEAENRGLDPRGTEEEVAVRLAQALKFDEQAIAELVLRYEDDTESVRGYAERIFALTHAPDLDVLATSVDRVVGRYVRVGVARWFVFHSAMAVPSHMTVKGLFRSFRAEPTEIDDEYAISPIEVSGRATTRFDQGKQLVRVESKGVSEANGALGAIQRVTGIQRSPILPITFDVPLELVGWDRRSLYLLDLVAHGLGDPPLFVQNLTAAHFETDEPEQVSSEIRPRIRSIRLEGDWVGDSPQACQMLVSKRTLVGVSMSIRYTPRADELYFFPVRINIAKDHIDVLTSLGKEHSDAARDAHRAIIERAERGLAQLTDPDKTIGLIAGIVARAEAQGPVSVELLSQPARDVSSGGSAAS